MIDLDKLEAAAKAAKEGSTGTWKAAPDAYVICEDMAVCKVSGNCPARRDFIALANPNAVLEMVEEIRRGREAETRRARLAEEYAGALGRIETPRADLAESRFHIAECLDSLDYVQTVDANFPGWGVRLERRRAAREFLRYEESKT